MTLVDLDIVTGKTYNRVCGSVCLCGIWRIECQVASFFPSPLLGQGLKVYRGREMRVGLSSTLVRLHVVVVVVSFSWHVFRVLEWPHVFKLA